MRYAIFFLLLFTGCATQQPALKQEIAALKAQQEQQAQTIAKVKQEGDIMALFLRRYIEVNPQAQAVVDDLGWKRLPAMELPKKTEPQPEGEQK